MIARLLLTVLLAMVLLYAWKQQRRSPTIGVAAMLAAFAGLYFVWMPAHASRLAEFMGIGRGVDLILYVWVAISLILLLNLHLKLQAQMELITQLARRIAIANPAQVAPPPESEQRPVTPPR